ncbi:MAG: anti-sigma factor antagonist [Methanoregula sp.]|nr:anti-sigma factor antagonist [Methanoregula sp.]
MSDVLQIARKKQDAIDVVCMSGRLDTNTAIEADAALRQMIASGGLQIVLNFKNLNYISSSGLRILIIAMREVKKKQGDLKLACLQPPVKEILHIAGFDRLFSLYETEEEAVKSFTYVAFDEKERRILDAIISTLDIDEDRRRTEGSLQQSEILYRAIFENSGTAMAIVEDDLTIYLANTEFEKMAGYTNKELAEVVSLLSFVVRNDLGIVTEFHELVRQKTDKLPQHYEFRLKDREGNIKNVYVILDMIPETPRRVYSLLDITELRKIEEDLRHELIRKREFIILAAHELRTPLQPVMGYLHLVLDDPDSYGLNADAKAILGKCSKNIDLMREIIEHIIKLSGLGYGPEQMLPRFKPHYREISPRQLLISYITVIQCSSDIAVDITIRDELKLITDTEYFYLIIQSLMYNIIRYSASPAKIGISHHDDEINNYFTIRNSSAVIAHEILPNLFKPYYVGDESKLLEKSGFIGLSLPVAKQMAEKLNGDISVTSNPDTGTVFTLVLPKSGTPG